MRFPPYKYVLLTLDIVLVFVSFYLAITWRFGAFIPNEYPAAIVLALVSAFVFQYNGLYRINVFLDRSASTVDILKSVIALGTIYAIGGFLTRFILIVPSRLAFAYFVSNMVVIFGVYRVVLLPVVFEKMSMLGVNRRNILIVGAGKCAQQFAAEVRGNKKLGLHIAGFVDDSVPVGTGVLNGYKVLGDSSEIDTLARSQGCDEIVIAIDKISHGKMLSLINHSKNTGATVKVVSELFTPVSSTHVTEAYTIHPTVTVTRGLYSTVTSVHQRISDIILSFIGLLILSPFLLMAALAIKLTSKGPILYTHERIGRDGTPFMMYKFRSMRISENGDEKRVKMMLEFMKNGNGNGKDHSGKVVDKARVTSVGKFMRQTSFDELPQLINVLRGDMSLVGPRPVLPYEYEAFKDWHHARDRALPGCTGYWQVYGRGKSSFDDMVMMDLYMMENMSPWMYLQLILKTVPSLVFDKGGR